MATAGAVEEVHVAVKRVPKYFLGFIPAGTKTVEFTSSELVGMTMAEAKQMVRAQIGHDVIRPSFLNGAQIFPSEEEITFLQAGDALEFLSP